MDNKDEAIIKIREVIKSACPGIDDYHLHFVKEMVEYFERLAKAEDPTVWLQYSQKMRLDCFADIRDHIKKDLIEDEDKYNYLWRDDRPKDDFEKGVLNAVRLIDFRIHCICD